MNIQEKFPEENTESKAWEFVNIVELTSTGNSQSHQQCMRGCVSPQFINRIHYLSY
jgi:hypothetical protein